MLVFVDESGDTGFKTDKGSSQFFIVSSVIFEDNDEAESCDQRISLLKKELGYNQRFEFHFADNPYNIRKRFLEAVQPYQFFYLSVCINKDPKKLYGNGFRNRDSFYKYACNLVFQNAKPYLNNAKIIFDKNGTNLFGYQLANYLKKSINTKESVLIKTIKMEKSHSNNLLQLADYVTGIVGRKVQRKDKKDYYRYISSKELGLQTWPK